MIFVIFKLFKRYGIDTFQAIVVNYFTAFTIGFTLYGNTWNPACLEQNNWMYFAGICALLFIGLFLVMGKSSQLNGVASTSIAVKMSMAISLIFMIIGYGESVTWLKILGIALAFVGVYLVSKPSKTEGNETFSFVDARRPLFWKWRPRFHPELCSKYATRIIDFFPFLCYRIWISRNSRIDYSNHSIHSWKRQIRIQNILAGIILGIPNYFSIYLLLRSYETTGWDDSTVLAITNVSVVLLSAIIGFTAFKESTTRQKIIGLISAILAICVLYICQLNKHENIPIKFRKF